MEISKETMILLSRDEYLKLKGLEDKDYNFEKRVSEIKKSYDDKIKYYNEELSNNGFFIEKDRRTTTCYINYGMIIGNKKLQEVIARDFGITRIIVDEECHISKNGPQIVIYDINGDKYMKVDETVYRSWRDLQRGIESLSSIKKGLEAKNAELENSLKHQSLTSTIINRFK